MGFFSEIASEARRGMTTPARKTAALPAAPEPVLTPPVAAPEAPAVQPVPAPPAPAGASSPPQAPPKTEPAPSAHTPPPPELKLSVDQAPDDTAARQAHGAAEAKRKAEFDAKQAEKRAKRQAALDRIKAMNDADLLSAAVGRVAADTERLTRRNMKTAVAEFISNKCREDAAFAMLVMDPDKSMVNCFQYINRKAQEYAEQEMKDNGVERTGVYGLDVPDGLCFQWAEDYFKEDHKDDEKFVPKPYVSPVCKKAAGRTVQKKSATAKPCTEKPTDAGMEQISLM